MGPPENVGTMMIVALVIALGGLIVIFAIVNKIYDEKAKNIIVAVKKFRYEYMKEYLKNGGTGIITLLQQNQALSFLLGDIIPSLVKKLTLSAIPSFKILCI